MVTTILAALPGFFSYRIVVRKALGLACLLHVVAPMTKHLVVCVLLFCALGLVSIRSARAKLVLFSAGTQTEAARQSHIISDAPLLPPSAPYNGQILLASPTSDLHLGALESLAVAESLLPRSGVSSRLEPSELSDQAVPFYRREAWNCMESVNFATSLSRTRAIYTQWPLEIYSDNLEFDDTWNKLEKTFRRGDVVVFWIRERINGNREFDFATHVQVCLGRFDEMWGANNEPRFELVRGVPAPTKKWWVCSSREYYQALFSHDATWRALGHDRRYYVVVYRCPESRGGLVSR